MVHTMAEALRTNFLGNSPSWYKLTIIGFLILNPILFIYSPYIAGWALVLEFIFTLAMALKCYPLQPGGLLAVEAIVLGLATPEMVYLEAEHQFPVIMLLMFMVAGIYFLREMLLFTFTKILLGVRSKVLLSMLFSFTAAVLSAFLDALTVTAASAVAPWPCLFLSSSSYALDKASHHPNWCFLLLARATRTKTVSCCLLFSYALPPTFWGMLISISGFNNV